MNTSRNLFYHRLLFVLPALILFLIFFYYPFFSSLYYSLTQWDGVTPAVYIGFTNYINLLQDDAVIQASLNTLYIVLFCMLIGNPLALLMALALNRPMKTRGILRTIFFIPAIMSLTVISVSWGDILRYDGVFNAILQLIGLGDYIQDWLSSTGTALKAVMIILVWQGTGFGAVIYLAGLQSIPKELYEASEIDGATSWRRLIHITIPLLMPVVTINTFIGLVGSLKLFDLPFILTNGGPGDATTTLGLLLYKFGFVFRTLGYATAAGILFMIVISLITFVQIRITRKMEVEL